MTDTAVVPRKPERPAGWATILVHPSNTTSSVEDAAVEALAVPNAIVRRQGSTGYERVGRLTRSTARITIGAHLPDQVDRRTRPRRQFAVTGAGH